MRPEPDLGCPPWEAAAASAQSDFFPVELMVSQEHPQGLESFCLHGGALQPALCLVLQQRAAGGGCLLPVTSPVCTCVHKSCAMGRLWASRDLGMLELGEGGGVSFARSQHPLHPIQPPLKLRGGRSCPWGHSEATTDPTPQGMKLTSPFAGQHRTSGIFRSCSAAAQPGAGGTQHLPGRVPGPGCPRSRPAACGTVLPSRSLPVLHVLSARMEHRPQPGRGCHGFKSGVFGPSGRGEQVSTVFRKSKPSGLG